MKYTTRIAALLLCCLLCVPLGGQVRAAGNGGRESRMYLYGGRSAIYTNNVGRTRGAVDVVLVDYFEVGADGSALLTHTPDIGFIKARQAEGYKVLAYVSNHWSQSAGIAAMTKRWTVTDTLAGWVKTYGLDGIDVDIENLTSVQRDAFTDFCRLLRQKLPSGYHVSAAVAPNPWGISSGWQGQYDYKALGQICDAVLLMTYDESYQNGEAGPVASYSFTENAVKEALKHIPGEKLLLGVPFYGRYWVNYTAGGQSKGKAFTLSDIDAITDHYRSTTWYDADKACARARVTVTAADSGIPLWGGKKMQAGEYDIWYENERSLRARMALAKEYDLAGVGAWALGQEPVRFWNAFRAWLQVLPFDDIGGHWAETELCELFEYGIIKGVDDTHFVPERGVVRAEACVMLCRLLNLDELSPPASAPAEIRNHPLRGYLWRAVQSGLLQGDGTGYHPDRVLTRSELAAFCERVLNVPDTMDFHEGIFPDVSSEMWFNKAVVTAYIHGVLVGRADGKFYPDDTCTRAEMAAAIRRMLHQEKKVPLVNGRRQMEKPPIEPR